MSNRASGRNFERRIEKYLQSVGFTTDHARAAVKWTPRGMMSGPNDFFGAADLVCIHADKPYTLFIQAHHGHSPGPRMAKLQDLPWNLNVQRVQLWQPLEGTRGGIRARMLMCGGINPIQWREVLFRMVDGLEVQGGLL